MVQLYERFFFLRRKNDFYGKTTFFRFLGGVKNGSFLFNEYSRRTGISNTERKEHMKTLIKKLFSILTIVTLAVALIGCGDSKSAETSSTADTIAGKYLPYSADFGGITMSYDDMVEADMVDHIYVTIDKNQKTGEANFGEGAGSFTLEDGKMVFEEDGETAKMGYEIQDDGSLKLCLTDIVDEDYGADIYIYFAKEGDAYEAAKQASQESGGTLTGLIDDSGDELTDWWNGEWYGWWMITSASGDAADMDGWWWDTCALIDIDDDYTGTVLIWDEDGSMDDPVGEVNVSLSEDGVGEHGTLYSEGGYFMDHELEHADWIIDPAVDFSSSWLVDSSADAIDNYIRMDGDVDADNDSYSYGYVVHLRKWGTVWDDVVEEQRPYYYDSWYLPLVEENKTMPYKIGDEDGTSATAEPKETETSSATEKSSSTGDGITTKDVLVNAYNTLYNWSDPNKSKFDLTYEEVVEIVGVEGAEMHNTDNWTDEKHQYCWYGEGTNVILTCTFKVNGNAFKLNNYALTGDY